MGLEAKCTVEWLATKRTAALHLDSRHLDVRLKPALRIAFDAIRSTRLEAGRLVLELPEGPHGCCISERTPPPSGPRRSVSPRADSTSSGSSLACASVYSMLSMPVSSASWRRLRESRRPSDSSKRAAIVILFTPDTTALAVLTSIKKALTPNGAVWVLRTKGKTAAVSEDAVRGAARRAGLVDVKVLAFSETLSALKLVIPVAKRSTSGQR